MSRRWQREKVVQDVQDLKKRIWPVIYFEIVRIQFNVGTCIIVIKSLLACEMKVSQTIEKSI